MFSQKWQTDAAFTEALVHAEECVLWNGTKEPNHEQQINQSLWYR